MTREHAAALVTNGAQLLFISILPAVIIVWVLVDFAAAMGTLGGQLGALFLLSWIGMKLSRSSGASTAGPASDDR
ncbi:membrane protein [Gordonia phage MossRose]|nr:membrane protein [Gordonia phage MossRose]